MRKVTLLAAPLAIVAMLAFGVTPAGAVEGVGSSVTVISPNLSGGFPCPGGGALLTAFQNYVNGQKGLAPSGCTGSIYSGATAAFSGAGVDSSNNPYAFAGVGTIAGSYYYSEPCQNGVVVPLPGDPQPLVGEAYGAPGSPSTTGGLHTTIPTATGFAGVNHTLINNGKIDVNFWWSRVGVTAIIGLRDLRASFNNGSLTVNDATARGLAAAVFVPIYQPNCTGGVHPTQPGDIEIVSGTLTFSSPA
jgi:hypothetical protein